MKSVFILCIAFAIAFSAQGSLLSSLSNAVSNVQNTITGVVDSVQSTINTASLVGQILWDNAFGPSWELFLNNGADWVDNYFGGILNAVGKKREIEVRLQLSVVQSVFQTQVTELIATFKSLVNEFVADALQTAANAIIPIVLGQTTINDVFGAVLGKLKTYIVQAVQHAVSSLQSTVQGFGPEAVQLAGALEQQLQNAASLFENQINAVSSFAINTVNNALAFFYNNFDDLITYFRTQLDKFTDEVNKILAASVIGLLFGITQPDDILLNVFNKLKEYAVETLQYTVTYVSQKLLVLYLQYQPLFNQAITFVQQFNLGSINLSTLQQTFQNIFEQLLQGSGFLLPQLISPTLLG